jgi:flagellar motor protein MotB
MRLLPLVALLPLPLTGCAIFSASQGDQQHLVSQLDREIMALQDQNRRLQEQLQNCGAGTAPDPIYAQLHQVFNYTEVEVVREGGVTRVQIPGEQLFAPGSTRVRQEADMVMDLLSTALKSNPGRRVLVIGHTDDQPISTAMYPSNWELSAARAAAFTRALAELHGVDTSNFIVGGRGSNEPIADNATAEGRAANRRIVVHIQPGDPE